MIDYIWLKAIHLIAVIAWMAGLLYLPRLFVYHSIVEVGSVRSETFKLMERRLLRVIMNPAMIVSWGLGIWMLILNSELLFLPWMWIKIGCAVAMTVCHKMFAKMRLAFEEDRAIMSDRRYRIWNEAPTIFMIIIIIMAVIKPF